MLAVAAAALGAPRRGDGTTSLMQFTNPEGAETMNLKASDCSLPSLKCHKLSMPEIRKLFTHGAPSNSLVKVGLLVHGFDGTLQGDGNNAGTLTEYNVTGEKDVAQGPVPLPWAPCDKGWCENSAKWLSTSIINSEHRAGFSDGGMILKPGANKVLCSHYYDFGSLKTGCTGGVNRDHTGDTPFPAEGLKEMLDVSMTYKQAYNEVLVNSTVYTSNLPHSISAFYYGLLPNEGNSTWSRLHTTAMYVAFLDHYNLAESQVPLVEFALDNPDNHGLLTDVSGGARKFLKAHPYGYALKKWREEHPELSAHPENIHLELRTQADMRRKASHEASSAKKEVRVAKNADKAEAMTQGATETEAAVKADAKAVKADAKLVKAVVKPAAK
jgi:hypothetical protein